MGTITNDVIIQFIESNIQSFHERRLESLKNLQLNKILTRKNPYLFKAKNQNTAFDLVKSVLDAYLSSQEEGIFGDFLENLAIFICNRAFGGKKSTAEGIDLEFERDGSFYLVSIKSGPNWGNSRQIAKMREDFKKAIRIRGMNYQGLKTIAVNGCCYGKDNKPNKGDYLKLCGQRFWEFISGEENLYIDIIEPLGFRAKERNKLFQDEYVKVINRFTHQFVEEYCDSTGAILWPKLVQINSGKE